MATIKVYPPSQLPDRGVSETQFKIWIEELEVYLSQVDRYEVFLKDGDYSAWQSQENHPNRLNGVKGEDLRQLDRTKDPANLKLRVKDLRTVLSIVGKCVSQGHYDAVVRHSTSMESIYNMLRCDYDIQQKGIHFLNILDMKYDATKLTPIAFYNQYRNMITNNLSRKNDIIKYKGDHRLLADERMSPMIEDMVLLSVINMIDPRLPAHVRSHYSLKMSKTEKLMDFKGDIMTNIPKFLQEMDKEEQLGSIKDSQLNWIKHNKGGNNWRNKNTPAGNQNSTRGNNQDDKPYCRMCKLAKQPLEVITSHSIGDRRCTELSFQDRKKLFRNSNSMANISAQTEEIVLEDECLDETLELAKENGYDDSTQVIEKFQSIKDTQSDFYRCEARLGYIRPVPTQILTVFIDESNKITVHIDVDSGATLNYVRLKEARENNFKILPNGQLSTLGDGVTKLPSVGEIDVQFFRNGWTVRYRALVTKDLQTAFIGGTVFLTDNFMEQDLNRKLIHIHNRKVTVQETNPMTLLPIQPVLQMTESPVNEVVVTQPNPDDAPKAVEVVQEKPKATPEVKQPASVLHSFKSMRVILPGQTVDLPVNAPDDELIAVEPWEKNKNPDWPQPQLCTVLNGQVQVLNETPEPIILSKDVQYIKTRTTVLAAENQLHSFYSPRQPGIHNIDIPQRSKCGSIKEIKQGEHINDDIKKMIDEAHHQHEAVFDKDLTNGYNDFYGRHRCELNWASKERPQASKVKVPNYHHDLQGLQQELMDDLTDQNVLLIPQEHNILVQTVCPSFLQRKQRAKDKAQHLLTKDDVRLLINFGPVNDKIKPIPSHVAKTDDVLIKLGRWKEIIIFDLYNGYFQIKMSDKSIPWLGVQTPFGGLRVIARSGQGLLGQAEEFDEVLAKVLKQELMDGICTKIVDDIYVGGETQRDAVLNYIRILSKLKNSNLKITASKTHIFPSSVDVLGWVWKRGGYLSPSPHRQCALTNVRQEDVKKIRDMRSWLGLYKTLHIATPNITAMLEPFEAATAGKDTADPFSWTHELTQQFRVAKNHVQNMKTLYLPSPSDQLMLVPDGSKMTPGIGHILYAIKDGKRIPVRFHNFKLQDNCRKWSPCEIEAMALAAGIVKEYDLLRESKHPIIVCPDSKPVHDAVSLINDGKFSTSARITSFLANVNRIPIISQHISGKAKLNPFADLQSRAPSECSAEICTIHRFVEEACDGVINPGARNGNITGVDPYASTAAWKKAQQNNPPCAYAKSLLTTGKTPPKATGKNAGEYHNEVRFYCREASVSKEGLLVARSLPDPKSGNVRRDRIIVPKLLAPALLYHLHNHLEDHPTRNQQKISFQRRFHTMELEKHLDNLYSSCYKCLVLQRLPQQMIAHESKQIVNGPHTNFHADVIKRAKQVIFTIKDHFSSMQNAIIIESERADDLKAAIILLTSMIRKPDRIQVTVDNAPGFTSLIKKKDQELEQLKIDLVDTDEFNKNANAVIDKGCQELEEEILKLSPEGQSVSQTLLAQAVMNLNRKIRRRGTISAFEIHTSRDLHTGQNLNLNDEDLRTDQLKSRAAENSKTTSEAVAVHVGDTVVVHNKKEKHKVKEMFIVTAKEGEKTKVQKVLHPLNQGNGRFMSKVYTTDEKRLRTIHRPIHVEDDDTEIEMLEPAEARTDETHLTDWNPVNGRFFDKAEDSDEDNAAEVSTTAHNVQLEHLEADDVFEHMLFLSDGE